MVPLWMLLVTLHWRWYNRICSVFLSMNACLSLHRSPRAVFLNLPHVTTHRNVPLLQWSLEFVIINSLMFFFYIRAQYTRIFRGTPSNTQHVCSGTFSISYSKAYWFESRPDTTHPDRVLLDLPQHLQSNSEVASRIGRKSFIPYSFDFTNNSAIPFYSSTHSQSAP